MSYIQNSWTSNLTVITPDSASSSLRTLSRQVMNAQTGQVDISPGDGPPPLLTTIYDIPDPDLCPAEELIRTEVVSVVDSETENVLAEVLDHELHAGVPVRVTACHHQSLLLL